MRLVYKLGKQFEVSYDNSKANSKSIFQGNKYRITVLTDRLVRFEYNEQGLFEDRPTTLVRSRKFDVPSIEVKEDKSFLEITTKYFKIEYAKEKPFKNKMVPSNNLKVSVVSSDKYWYYGHPEVRNFFGTATSLDDVTERIKLKKGLYSSDGFATIDDSNSYVIDEGGMVIPRETIGIDIYLFVYRKDFGLCLADYFGLTGYPPLVPRYVLGNWWCREKDYSEYDIYALLNEFKRNEIPISTLLLDKGWHIRHNAENKIFNSGYSWNKKLFPAPYEFIDELHKKNIRLGVRVNPKEGIYPHETMYRKAISYLEVPEGKTIPFAPLNPRFLDVYLKLFIHPSDMLGLDFWWIDSKFDNKDINSLDIINRYHYLDSDREEKKRGMILSRNGGIGSHRYPILTSGDTIVSWNTLKLIPYFTASASNIGISWWSHDIGGHHGGIEDRELYIRYIQFGVFSPILRFHVEEGNYYKREPWRWDKETLEIAKDYMQLRHILIPYLYTEAYNYHKTGMPILQPIYYKFPRLFDDDILKNQYYFGTQLMVAPIINAKDVVMDRVKHVVFLPKGIWYDFRTGKKFNGGGTYTIFYKDEDYPVFAKAGAIIPLAQNNNTNDTRAPKDLMIDIFPGRSNTYNLYEDDGYTNLYKEGFYLITSFDYNYRESNYTLIIRAVEGKSNVITPTRNYKIKFRNTKKANDVLVYENDKRVEFISYVDGNDFIIEIKEVSVLSQITINCKGKDIEIDALRVINDDINSIISDLMIKTKLKEEISKILFSDIKIKNKRIEIRKLKRKGLEKKFIRLFLNLLEHVKSI